MDLINLKKSKYVVVIKIFGRVGNKGQVTLNSTGDKD